MRPRDANANNDLHGSDAPSASANNDPYGSDASGASASKDLYDSDATDAIFGTGDGDPAGGTGVDCQVVPVTHQPGSG